ncbi:uracil-DNA glycosylase [Ideonella margarita]|uniref:Uracil-DNA glycosylase n=1 Tax=Ideonella margarita TaxID=2984191 RepID=A0ABU9C692_9BURK
MADLFGDAAPAPNALTWPLAVVLDEAAGTLASGWLDGLQTWRTSPEGQRLLAHVQSRQQAGAVIYPARPLRALELTPLDAVRVVILGQDPYHGPGQAEGLAFSVPSGVKVPPSLRNIFVELQRDLGLHPPRSGSLLAWTQQGVLLLNASLTVEDGQAASHAGMGWEALTDAVIETVARREGDPVVFLLWGAHAQAKTALIEAAGRGRHLLLRANHPSPLSARRPPTPFIGCGHFSAAMAHVPGLDWGATQEK